MNAQPEPKSLRTGLMVFGLLLIVASVGRFAAVLPDWLSGAPPVYPGQYERRLFSVLTSVPLLSAVLLMQQAGTVAPGKRRLALAWAMLALSVIVMLVDVLRG